MDSYGFDLNSYVPSEEKGEEMSSTPAEEGAEVQCGDEELRAEEQPQVKCSSTGCVEQDSSAETHNYNTGDQIYSSNFKPDRSMSCRCEL